MATNPTLRRFFIVLCTAALNLALPALAQNTGTIGGLSNGDEEKEPILEPEKKIAPVKTAQIDTEKFELGVFAGVLNVEDFNANSVVGASFSFHLNDKVLSQLHYGRSRVGNASFEENVGMDFLADEDYNYSYLELTAGYKVLSGRSFLGRTQKMMSGFYLLGGVGQTQFADNSGLSLVFAGSYRVVVTDWMTMNLDFRNHMFDREFIADSKLTNNTEMVIGISALF